MPDSINMALAVGIGDAKPLPFLRGAINSAVDFSEWAAAQGYVTALLTDEDEPVTIEKMRGELNRLLASADKPIHRFLLYYAGHGLIRGAEEGLWLLSDWYGEMRAVAIEVLKRRLSKYGVGQIAIFSDACRTLPADTSTADLVPDAVLGRGPLQPKAMPPVDKFVAAQDGDEAFIIPAASPKDDRCLFSGVLMEGLWGENPAAFSKLLDDKVTSGSLGAFLQSEVNQRASRYNCTATPSYSSSFPEGDNIYSEKGKLPPRPRVPRGAAPGRMEIRKGLTHGLNLNLETAARTQTEDCIFKADRLEVCGKAADGLWVSANLRHRYIVPLIHRLWDQPLPEGFAEYAGFAVKGEAKALWLPAGMTAETAGSAAWWFVHDHGAAPPGAVPVLIEFANGDFAALTALPGFIADVETGMRGVHAVVYYKTGAELECAEAAEKAVGRLARGVLRADGVQALAVQLRHDGIMDPTLGTICAYLYDAAGDTNSIRRIAHHFLRHAQPIPYDIALLAQLKGELREGLLRVQLPAVPKSTPQTPLEEEHRWLCSGSRKGEGPVAGFWPWLRQGWTFLDEAAEDGSTLVLPGIAELERALAAGLFTTLKKEGGRELARLLNLRRVLPRAKPIEPEALA
jgi:hypothetical protein